MTPSSARSPARIRGPSHASGLPSPSTDANTRSLHFRGPRSPSLAPESLFSRLEAVDRDAARRQFAFYGRQNAHVDHISGTDQERDTAATTALKSTLLLQENGELAARLDDVKYLLDGILEPVKTQKGSIGRARSVLELTKLLQDQQIKQIVGLPSQRSLRLRVKEVLQTQLGVIMDDCGGAEEMHRVSLAVLTYFLSLSGEGEGYFDEKELDALVRALKHEVERESRCDDVGRLNNVDDKRINTGEESLTALPRRKTCLKRKQTRLLSSKKRMEDDTVIAATSCGENNGVYIFEEEVPLMSTGVVNGLKKTRSTLSTVTDELWQMKLDELLHDDELFILDGELHISTTVALYAALHNLVQMNSLSSNSASAVDVAQRYHQRSSESPDDAMEDTMQLIRARKLQLVRNGGLDLIIWDLGNKLSTLHASLPSTLAEPVSLKCARTLHSIKLLLSVLDQVSFLIVDVQRYLSKRKYLFRILLDIVRLLADLGWGKEALKRWEVNSSRLIVTMDALVAALRVLINLTHHNTEATRHVYALGGMQLLTRSFFHLVCVTSNQKKNSRFSEILKKWEFDACLLLLSAMVNCVEFNNDNRDALANISLSVNPSSIQAERVGTHELFAQFFLSKVQSYAHLIDSNETEDAIEAESGDWHPEDIILGGCASLLLGYLMKGSSVNSASILKYLPGGSPKLLLRALGVFVAFHSQIGALTPEVVESVLRIESVFKTCICSDGGTDLSAGGIPDSSLKVLSRPSHTEEQQQGASSKTMDPLGLSTLNGDKSQDCYQRRSAVLMRSQSVKNVCSNIDESDQESEPNFDRKGMLVREEYVGSRGRRGSGMSTLARSPQCSPPRRQSGVQSPNIASTPSIKSPRRVKRSPLTAVNADGTLSSPVVARLLKRTRQLVDEFDVEYAKLSHPLRGGNKQDSQIDNESSTREVLTMDVTCRDNGNDNLDICQDVAIDDSTAKKRVVARFPPFKRRKKHLQKAEVGTSIGGKNCNHNIESHLDVFDFVVENKLPSTPQRKQKDDSVLQTPTRAVCSSAAADQPLLVKNLTPTRKSPTMPMMKVPTEQLQLPTRNGRSSIMNHSPALASPLRRLKTARTSSAGGSSAVFDFTE